MRRRTIKTGCLVTAIVVPVVVAILLVVLANRMANAPSISCEINLKIICLSARSWAADAKTNVLPGDFLTFTNEVENPKWLHCPADKAHARATGWLGFTMTNCSYVLRPGVESGTTNEYVRCVYHSHVGMADGSIVRGPREQSGKNP